jgi:hypothetical protein
MDFGWDHPFAAVELVWDRDSDVVYVAKTHRLKGATPIIHGPLQRLASAVARPRPRQFLAPTAGSGINTRHRASTCCTNTPSSRTAAYQLRRD